MKYMSFTFKNNIFSQSILGGSGKIFCSSAKILCSYDFEESSLQNLTIKNINDVKESKLIINYTLNKSTTLYINKKLLPPPSDNRTRKSTPKIRSFELKFCI